jgi:NAD(P)-dependent dehydrogenase (short-subunit alcohol dehydrogenase family)
MGPALVAKHVVPHLRRAGGGAIVNLASISSFIAQPRLRSPPISAPPSMRQLLSCIMRQGARLPVGKTQPGSAGSGSAGRRRPNHGCQADTSLGLPNRALLNRLNLTPDDLPPDLPPDPRFPGHSRPSSRSCGPACSKTL